MRTAPAALRGNFFNSLIKHNRRRWVRRTAQIAAAAISP
jgi:hypothetical protein